MNPDAVSRVRTTAAAAAAHPGFAAAFYAALFRRAPAVEAMFSSSLVDQEQKFSDQLGAIMRSLDDYSAFRSEAALLGSRHQGYGVEARHYAIATDALVEALRSTLGDTVDNATEDAWRAALDLIAEEMQAGGEAG